MSVNVFCIWTIIIVLTLVNCEDITGITKPSGQYFVISASKYDTFQFNTVKCSSNHDNCYVVCDVYNGCYATKIHAQNVSNLYLQCVSERACDTAQILSSPNSNLFVKCDQPSSCNQLKINASNINDNVSVECNSTSSCYQMQIGAQKSNQFSLTCNGTNACYGIKLTGPQTNAKQTSVANIECFGSTSCQNAVFNLPYTRIRLECNYSSSLPIAKWYTIENASCHSTTLYAAASYITNITCNEYNCYKNNFNFNFHTYNLEETEAYTSIEFHGYSRLNTIDAQGNALNAVQSGLTMLVYCYNDLSCYDATIYAPPNDQYQINCTTANACVGTNISPMYMSNNNVVCFDENNNSYSTLHYNATSQKYQCGTVQTYTCCPFGSGLLNICEEGEDCIIDCAFNTLSGTCENYIIDASKANSLILYCNTMHNQGFGCQYATIKCPLNNHTSCNIRCSEFGSCQNAVIDVSANHTNEINVECSGEISCYNINYNINYNVSPSNHYNAISSINIKALSINCAGYQSCYDSSMITNKANISEFNWNCLNYQSCYSSKIQIKVNKKVNINCKAELACSYSTVDINGLAHGSARIECTNQGISSSVWDGACRSAHIQISESSLYLQSSNISMNCYPYDCYDATFDIQNGNIVTMSCDVPNACYESKIFASNAKLLDMICADYHSCYNSQVRCPYSKVNSCSITCSSDSNYACNYLHIYVPDDYAYGYLNLLCNDHICGSVGIGFDCERKISTNYLYDNISSCDEVSPVYCCPWIDDDAINCDANKKCIIECSSSKQNCVGGFINGTLASSLTISCNEYEVCQNAYVLCPINGHCAIECGNADRSCESLKVVNNDNNYKSNINLQCESYYACYQASIYSPYTNKINLICSDTYSCLNLVVDAANAVELNITCIGDHSCYYMTINASFVKEVSLHANVESAFHYGSLYAYYSNRISVTCSSYKSDKSSSYYYGSSVSACYGSFYVNATGLTLNCYGYGCYDVRALHTMNSNISSANIYINGCGQCYSSDDCCSSWNIYCDESLNPAELIFHGGYCSNSYQSYYSPIHNQCGCDAAVTKIKNNFVNDNSHSLCTTAPPTSHQTYPTYPTYSSPYPTFPTYPRYPTPYIYPTYSNNSIPSSKQKSSNYTLKFVVAGGVVLIILVLVACLMDVTSKNKRKEREGRISRNNNNNNDKNGGQQRKDSQVEGVNDYAFGIKNQEGLDQSMLNEADVAQPQIVD